MQPRWFLWRRGNGRYYACRHNPDTRQVERRSLGTDDPAIAEIAFHRFAIAHDEIRDVGPSEMTVAQVVARYAVLHADKLAGADVQKRALRYCVEDFGDLAVSALTPQRQQAFITRMKERGYGEPYIKRTLGAARAALGWAYKRGELTAVPYIITGDLRDSEPRQRVLEVDELQAFWKAIDYEPLARWFVLLLGTGARPRVLVDLGPGQVDVLRRRIDLQPPGVAATKKRNPTVVLIPSLLPWLAEPRAPTVIGRQMKVLRTAWAATRDRAHIDARVIPYSLRHTLATHMDEQDVPEGQIRAWFGHGKESTTAHWYVKRRVYRPGYLAKAADAAEALVSGVVRHNAENVSSVRHKSEVR